MICETLAERIRGSHARVVFADAHDPRIIEAIEALVNDQSVHVIALISREHAERITGRALPSVVDFVDPAQYSDEVAQFLLGRRSAKGLTSSDAQVLARDPLFVAGWLVHAGLADAAVAGSISTTADVIRAALWTIGLAPGNKTLSSYFLMDWPDRYYLFADCGVVPDPSTEQLVDIAVTTACSLKALASDAPSVAFISFSTLGSAQHPHVDKVRRAVELFRQQHPNILADGELQVDAAIVPSVASRKAPHSPVAGNANILVFPDLDAGNSAYKITERLAGAHALGPILQGLAKPFCDLSRGCSSQDIVSVARIAALMSAGT